MLAAAAIFAAATLSLSSCGNPASKVEGLYKDAAKKVEKAESYDEIKEIDEKLQLQVMEIGMKNKDFEPTEEQEEAIKEARKAYRNAKRDATKKF